MSHMIRFACFVILIGVVVVGLLNDSGAEEHRGRTGGASIPFGGAVQYLSLIHI